jgi:hypothetical protein
MISSYGQWYFTSLSSDLKCSFLTFIKGFCGFLKVKSKNAFSRQEVVGENDFHFDRL